MTSRPDVPIEHVLDHRPHAVPRVSPPDSLDAKALEDDLRAVVKGEVRFDDGSRAMYSTDASNYRQIPIGVVVPRDEEDVIEAVRVCREHGAPITSRGGGTSLAGQTCNVAIILDFSKHMNRVLGIDAERKRAVVQPGVVLDELRAQAKRHALTFGPDPSTHDRCTLGGMIGNNSCGTHAQMAGPTVAQVEELDVLLYDGTRLTVGATSEAELAQLCERGDRIGDVYRRLRRIRDENADEIRARYPDIPRRISGYNLDQLLEEKGFHVARALVGTEGTCVIVLKATVRLVPDPEHRVLVIAGFPDVFQAADAVPDLDRLRPIGFEAVDETLVEKMRERHMNSGYLAHLPEGKAWLYLEFAGATKDEAHARADDAIRHVRERYRVATTKIFDDPALEEQR